MNNAKPSTPNCFVFDIDGTLADNSHRARHLKKVTKDWDAYHAEVMADRVIPHMRQLVWALCDSLLVFCSGRHESLRRQTTDWFLREGLVVPRNLYMRKDGDHRPDHVVKRELLAEMRADGFEPIMVFDDRNSVVKMWREAGVPCAQVADGDF